MMGVSNRQIRQAVDKQAKALTETVVPMLRAVMNDELKTRGRVDALEQWRDSTLWQRVRWVVWGFRG